MDWQGLCDLNMGLHYCAIVEFLSQTASCLSISKSQVRTSGKAEGACSEKSFSRCTRVPKMSSAWVMISLQGVDIRVILRYNGTVQDNTKFVAFYCYPLSELWHVGQLCSSSSSSLLFLHTDHRWGQIKGQRSSQPSRVASRSQRAKKKIWSSSETLSDLQVGMLSHKALSVSDLKGRSEREKSRDKRQTEWGYFHSEKMAR